MNKALESLDYIDGVLFWEMPEKYPRIKDHIKIIHGALANNDEVDVEISKSFIPLQTTPYEMFLTHICPKCKTKSVFNFSGERNNFCGNCGAKLNWLRKCKNSGSDPQKN